MLIPVGDVALLAASSTASVVINSVVNPLTATRRLELCSHEKVAALHLLSAKCVKKMRYIAGFPGRGRTRCVSHVIFNFIFCRKTVNNAARGIGGPDQYFEGLLKNASDPFYAMLGKGTYMSLLEKASYVVRDRRFLVLPRVLQVQR